MIDFIKLKISNPDINGIRNNPALEWFEKTNTRTGEVKEYTAINHGITFEIIQNKYLNIYGSIHKHWNSLHGRGEQNYNDFNFAALIQVINEFCKMFDLVPGSCILENIEFGVNITPTIPVNEILRSVINHKGKPFSQEYSENKRFRECERQRYIIKIYNKGLQYDQGNILRFENKILKMIQIKDTGIVTLSDLLDPVNINRLGSILKTNFNELLFYDYTIPVTGINARDRLILTQGQTPAYWLNLLETKPDGYYKKRNRFKELAKKYGTREIQEIISPLIAQKWDELIQANHKTVRKLTGGAKTESTEINHSDKGLKPVLFNFHSNDPDQFNREGETRAEGDSMEPPPQRYCLGCGKDISDQRPGSKFCSAKNVGYIQAHKCRNTDSNPRNRIRYMKELEKINPPLFDTIPYFIERNRSKPETILINKY